MQAIQPWPPWHLSRPALGRNDQVFIPPTHIVTRSRMLGRRHGFIPDGSLQILELLTGGSILVTTSCSEEASPPLKEDIDPMSLSLSHPVCFNENPKTLYYVCHIHTQSCLIHLIYGNNHINLGKISRIPTVLSL